MEEFAAKITHEPNAPTGSPDSGLFERSDPPKDTQALLDTVELLSRKNRYAEARQLLMPIIDAELQNSRALYWAGNISVALNEVERAKSYYEKALELGFAPQKTAAALALIEKALGNKRKTEELLKKAGGSRDSDVLPTILLYSLYMEQSRFDDAQKTAEKLCGMIPQSYFGYHAKLSALLSEQSFDKAEDYLNSLCGQFGEISEYVYDYVSTLLLLKKPEEADSAWQAKQSILDKDSLRFLRIEAQIASELHDKERTLDANKKLYERFNIENAAITIAMIYIVDQNYLDALEYLNSAVKRKRFSKTYFSALYLKAFCTEMARPDEAEKAYKEAVQIYEEAIQKNVINTYALGFAAECYKKLGDTDNAARCERALSDFKQKYGV